MKEWHFRLFITMMLVLGAVMNPLVVFLAGFSAMETIDIYRHGWTTGKDSFQSENLEQ